MYLISSRSVCLPPPRGCWSTKLATEQHLGAGEDEAVSVAAFTFISIQWE